MLLNQAQLTTILSRVSDLHREVLTSPEWRVSAGGKSHRHDLPAIAWRQILDSMLAQVYGPLGGKKAADSAYTACARIQKGLMRLEHHPCLMGEAIVGVSNEVIPAWNDWDGDNQPVTIYPGWGENFVLKRPVTFVERGWTLTKWMDGEPRRPGESRTFEAESHYLFTS